MTTLTPDATVKGGDVPITGRCGTGKEAPLFRKARKPVALQSLLDEVQRCADLPLADAMTLPAEVYTCEEFLEWEADHVLRSDWLGVAHVSQIPLPGDFLNIDVLGEPLIVVRGKDDQIRVLSRVCPHRAMDIMPPGFGYDRHGPAETRPGQSGCGHTRLFLCPYHHWTFELDGTLKACPEMQQANGFQRDDVGLTSFRAEIFEGFIFVNLAGKAAPLTEQYKELKNDIFGWNCDEMTLVIQKEWDCAFNWKVLVENFMEAYHHLGAHCKTLQPLMPAKHTWTEAERAHSVRVNLPFKDGVAESLENDTESFSTIPMLPDEHRNQMAVFLGQPSFLLFGGPDRMFWYRIEPISPDRSRLYTSMLVRKESLSEPNADAKLKAGEKILVDFHLEDMEVCIAVQRGFYATGYQRGRLSHLEMPIWLIQRYLAARARGTYPTMDRSAAAAQR